MKCLCNDAPVACRRDATQEDFLCDYCRLGECKKNSEIIRKMFEMLNPDV